MILASMNGNLISCKLIRETPNTWFVDYCDKKYPKEQPIPKKGNRQLFSSVDDALDWIGISLND